nr:hypothetical protein [Bradyrhizobium sp. CCBAU 051011]
MRRVLIFSALPKTSQAQSPDGSAFGVEVPSFTCGSSMRSMSVAGATSRPGRTSAHSRLRANSTTAPLRFSCASACGCSMLAEANTSALAPAAISSFSKPEAPNFACTLPRFAASNAFATSLNAARKLPAA